MYSHTTICFDHDTRISASDLSHERIGVRISNRDLHYSMLFPTDEKGLALLNQLLAEIAKAVVITSKKLEDEQA